MSDIADNIARLRERITLAAERSGRRAEDITLVTVTKKQPASTVMEALAAGVTDVGENYVQEATEKHASVQYGRWHLLGHLQGNKAKQAVGLFDLIQSVDSVKLAQTLGRQAQSLGKTQNILLQVHLGSEETKTGFAPAEALDAAAEMAGASGVSLQGLMGIAPFSEDARPYFRVTAAF